MGKKQKQESLPQQLIVTKEEENIRILFDFCYWLENIPGKGGLPGATALLRLFLTERSKL